MKAGNEVASALADKIKAVDVLKTPGLDDPEVRARFETYLSLKEVPQARIEEYFGKMTAGLRHAEGGRHLRRVEDALLPERLQDLDAGISRELAARVETFWNTDRTKNGLEMANNQVARRYRDRQSQRRPRRRRTSQQEQARTRRRKNGKGGSNSRQQQSSASNTTNSPLIEPERRSRRRRGRGDADDGQQPAGQDGDDGANT